MTKQGGIAFYETVKLMEVYYERKARYDGLVFQV